MENGSLGLGTLWSLPGKGGWKIDLCVSSIVSLLLCPRAFGFIEIVISLRILWSCHSWWLQTRWRFPTTSWRRPPLLMLGWPLGSLLINLFPGVFLMVPHRGIPHYVEWGLFFIWRRGTFFVLDGALERVQTIRLN